MTNPTTAEKVQEWPFTLFGATGKEYVPKEHANKAIERLTAELASLQRERDVLQEKVEELQYELREYTNWP